MSGRTIQDRLREEYFDLLPQIALVADEMTARIQFYTLEIAQSLHQHEYLIVKPRIKECQSSITALEKRVVASAMSERLPRDSAKQPDRLGTFNPDTPNAYSLTRLHDLAGVRVLAFPPHRLKQIDAELRKRFPDWTADPFKDIGDQSAFKYFGLCPKSSASVLGEYQIVSTLIGLFWEVEHAAIYKSAPNLKAFINSPPMRERTSEVYRSLKAFEEEFERQLKQADQPDPINFL